MKFCVKDCSVRVLIFDFKNNIYYRKISYNTEFEPELLLSYLCHEGRTCLSVVDYDIDRRMDVLGIMNKFLSLQESKNRGPKIYDYEKIETFGFKRCRLDFEKRTYY